MSKLKVIIPSILGLMLALVVIWAFIPIDTINKIQRKGIELTDGDFNVTYSQDNVVKTYKVRNGKVTSDPKGYYYFWVKNTQGKKKYHQVPIDKTIIEEI